MAAERKVGWRGKLAKPPEVISSIIQLVQLNQRKSLFRRRRLKYEIRKPNRAN